MRGQIVPHWRYRIHFRVFITNIVIVVVIVITNIRIIIIGNV